MIHLIFFALLGFTACHPSMDDPLLHFLEQLELDRSDVYMDGVVIQEISDNLGSTAIAAVIPVLAESPENHFELDAYILLANSVTGEISAVFTEEKAWTSDAYVLRGIEIESEVYPIGSDTHAIGVVLSYQSSSRVNRVESRELSLFVEEEGGLNRVLKDYYVMGSEIVIDGECDRSSSSFRRNIDVTDQRSNTYSDLKVTEERERSEVTHENCTPQTILDTPDEFYLKFRDGGYQP